MTRKHKSGLSINLHPTWMLLKYISQYFNLWNILLIENVRESSSTQPLIPSACGDRVWTYLCVIKLNAKLHATFLLIVVFTLFPNANFPDFTANYNYFKLRIKACHEWGTLVPHPHHRPVTTIHSTWTV